MGAHQGFIESWYREEQTKATDSSKILDPVLRMLQSLYMVTAHGR